MLIHLNKTNLSKIGAALVTDSYTPTTSTTSGVFKEITLSSTRKPKCLFVVSPFTVDIPDIDLFTVTTLLLSNIFCFVLILTFLTVAFTTIFD